MTYRELLDTLESGDVILTYNKLSRRRPLSSFFSWAVRRACDEPGDRARTNHAGLYYGLVDGEPYVIESSFRVRLHPLASYLGVNGQQCLIAKYKPLQVFERNNLAWFAKSKEGKRYGYGALGLVGLDVIFKTKFFTRRLRQKSSEMVCSSLVAWAYNLFSYRFNDLHPAGVTPDDIYDAIYDGSDKENWNVYYDAIPE